MIRERFSWVSSFLDATVIVIKFACKKKTKTKQMLPITNNKRGKHIQRTNQNLKLTSVTGSQRQAREKANEQITIGLLSASDWIRMSPEVFSSNQKLDVT